MDIVLFDTAERNLLFPLIATRPVAEIRIGILTLAGYWKTVTAKNIYYLTEKYLQAKFPAPGSGDCLFINASWVPSAGLTDQVLQIKPGHALWAEDCLIAGRLSDRKICDYSELKKEIFITNVQVNSKESFINYPWDLLKHNAALIRDHFSIITQNRESQPLSSTNQCINTKDIFIEQGAIIEHALINATEGPVYIGKNCTVMEGSLIRGPFAMCEGSLLKMGTKIYAATTLGPFSIAGGEIKNSIFLGYANKAHDGYLGDSVLGEFCNLGAGTSCSNVKNTGKEIQIWIQALNNFIVAGNKCGVFMGDHTRCAINTSVNSGTVTGICNNIFGTGLTPKFIKSFSWGMNDAVLYDFDKAIHDCTNWMQFKNQSLTGTDKKILKHIFDNR